MIILGAGGHALEVLDIVRDQYQDIEFLDELASLKSEFHGYKVIDNLDSRQNQQFIAGIGGKNRRNFIEKALKNGLDWKNVVASTGQIGSIKVKIDLVDVMDFVTISSNVTIGKGTLLNRNSNIHHGCEIGDYCEVCPGATLLGNVVIENSTIIGSMSVILPNIRIGKNVIIGAGSVVTSSVPDGQTVIGNPAKPISRG